MEEMRNAHKIVIRKPGRKRQRGRPKHRWENNIRVDAEAIEREGVGLMHLAQDKVHLEVLVSFRIP
jgi:hypothetical protein